MSAPAPPYRCARQRRNPAPSPPKSADFRPGRMVQSCSCVRRLPWLRTAQRATRTGVGTTASSGSTGDRPVGNPAIPSGTGAVMHRRWDRKLCVPASRQVCPEQRRLVLEGCSQSSRDDRCGSFHKHADTLDYCIAQSDFCEAGARLSTHWKRPADTRRSANQGSSRRSLLTGRPERGACTNWPAPT